MPKRDKAVSPRASPPHTPPPGTDSEAEEADQAGASAAEMGTYKCCIFFTRRFALADTSTPEDVRLLFSRYAGGSPYMVADDLRRYLATWGGADGEVPEQIIDRILQDRSRTPRFGRPALTVDDFLHFLFSEDLNPPLHSSKVKPPGSCSIPNPLCCLISLFPVSIGAIAGCGGGLCNVVKSVPLADHIGICIVSCSSCNACVSSTFCGSRNVPCECVLLLI